MNCPVYMPSVAMKVSVFCLYLYGSLNVTLASGAPRPGSCTMSCKDKKISLMTEFQQVDYIQKVKHTEHMYHTTWEGAVAFYCGPLSRNILCNTLEPWLPPIF